MRWAGTGDSLLAPGGGASLCEPLARLVDRLHTRVPMHEALRRFADDLDDPSADMIIAALIINSRLRGPGLRALLGALATSVREELDMRRKVNASAGPPGAACRSWSACPWPGARAWPCSTRPLSHGYDSSLGQLVLVVMVALYAAGSMWMRKLATFDMPERLLTSARPALSEAAEDAAAARAGCVMIAPFIVGAVAGRACSC